MSDRELDVKVHTEVMGHPRNWPITRDPKYLYMSIDGEWIRQEPPPYSRDIAAAWPVAEKMGERFGVRITIFVESVEVALIDFIDGSGVVDVFVAEEDTFPLAICRAAVMAAEAGK